MADPRRRKSRRKSRQSRFRIGRVTYYLHHHSWWVYYRLGGTAVRKRIAEDQETAERLAAQINARLLANSPTFLDFNPITIQELRPKFLDHHAHVRRSSPATVRRYRSATLHLEEFAIETGLLKAHQIDVERFARYLASKKVSPNGHPNASLRRLQTKGIQFILESCRALFNFAKRNRHLPPFAENPFTELGLEGMRIDDAKPVFVFDSKTEIAFLEATDDWSFSLFFVYAKTGLRVGELTHLLIEDLDLCAGWLHVRNKKELGWRIKTGSERSVPLINEVILVLRKVIGSRTAGPVFLRPKFDATPARQRDRRQMAARLKQILHHFPLGDSSEQESLYRASRKLWSEVGTVDNDQVRLSFCRVTRQIGHAEATCPKSWRHTFATLLQDANVDPLIRQITMGHRTAGNSLGMTAVYTHTRQETQKQEIERALRLWPASLELARNWSDKEV